MKNICENLKKEGIFKDNTDGTIKNVYRGENKIIEISNLYNNAKRDVVCVPSHNFCSLGCKMCHLTNNKLNKKMNQIHFNDFIGCLLDSLKYFENKDNLLISFMGVGEPQLNLKLINDLFINEKIIKEKYGYKNIGYSLSTMMPFNNIDELINVVLTNNIPLKLHFSLHSPIDKKRNELIPATKVNVKKAFELLSIYRRLLNKNEIIKKEYSKFHNNFDFTEIHYTLIKNVNDTDEELELLYNLSNTYKIPIKFISFNPKNDLKKSNKEEKWANKLKEIDGLIVKRYCPPGREIGSSCGEFTKHYYHEEIETEKELKDFQKWKDEHEIKDYK